MHRLSFFHRAASAKILALALGLALLPGCKKPVAADSEARQYEARGIVRGLSPDGKGLEVEHETIPGFMPSMTMPFEARDRAEIAGLHLQDAIAFQIHVTKSGFWISGVKKIDAGKVHLPKPVLEPQAQSAPGDTGRLREGDAIPAFSLVNETGVPVGPATFRGRPWLVTFIFTRCPMPNFCPLMAKNFFALQREIANGGDPAGRLRLLSVTLDPRFDTPAVLSEYGKHEGADPAVWNFATGEPQAIDRLAEQFSVYRKNEGGSISHGLATALIDGKGRIVKIWRGNGWTPADVIKTLGASGNPVQ